MIKQQKFTLNSSKDKAFMKNLLMMTSEKENVSEACLEIFPSWYQMENQKDAIEKINANSEGQVSVHLDLHEKQISELETFLKMNGKRSLNVQNVEAAKNLFQFLANGASLSPSDKTRTRDRLIRKCNKILSKLKRPDLKLVRPEDVQPENEVLVERLKRQLKKLVMAVTVENSEEWLLLYSNLKFSVQQQPDHIVELCRDYVEKCKSTIKADGSRIDTVAFESIEDILKRYEQTEDPEESRISQIFKMIKENEKVRVLKVGDRVRLSQLTTTTDHGQVIGEVQGGYLYILWNDGSIEMTPLTDLIHIDDAPPPIWRKVAKFPFDDEQIAIRSSVFFDLLKTGIIQEDVHKWTDDTAKTQSVEKDDVLTALNDQIGLMVSHLQVMTETLKNLHDSVRLLKGGE